MMILHAPYNFVPVADTVATGWGNDLPAQDYPYPDGLCGELTLRVVAETPLLISGEQDAVNGADNKKPKTFFLGPDNRPAIPGSSLKGMLRGLVEIISFARMGPHVEDRRFGLRDLSGPVQDSYRNYFTDYGDGEGKSLGGWLRFADGRWVIAPCEVSRITYDELKALNPRFRADRQAENTYASWGNASLAHKDGTLVFTGKVPINNPKKEKKAEFVFRETGAAPLPVPDDIWRGFLDVHEHQEKPSPTWRWWQKRYKSGKAKAIPVFYLHDPARGVIALGLAQMFKLAMPYTTHDALPRAHTAEPRSPADLDLVERIFGRVAQDALWEVAPEVKRPLTLRGRVSIGMAQLDTASATPRPLGGKQGFETVTGGPKAGFFPAYLRQPDMKGRDSTYITYMNPNARIRGWKRYPGQMRSDFTPLPTPKQMDERKIGKGARSRLQPIAGDGDPLIFTARLRYHNLRPEELGALVWALRWGGDSNARHALGMGKAYGWGRVAIDVTHGPSRANDPERSVPSLDEAMETFEHAMDAKIGGWRNTPQIRALLAMAVARDPREAKPHELRYHSGNPQDFQKAKNDRAILPGYGYREDELGDITPAVTLEVGQLYRIDLGGVFAEVLLKALDSNAATVSVVGPKAVVKKVGSGAVIEIPRGEFLEIIDKIL